MKLKNKLTLKIVYYYFDDIDNGSKINLVVFY